ncbi:MAG: response regulator transcription factor [Anaerolineales bacterium]|nr:response regulator transcription factor [Anaerolineales bacterium]MCB8952792.1 response regulator transcription factor [Ardenticatenales bacterium]
MQTILVVDDKASVRLLLREYLEEQGFRVVTAENGRMALFVARQAHPDVILLDIMMPEMDGYQFITHHRREANTPVIVITARNEETDAVIGLELGADDYVTKPFRLRELVARIHALLRRVGQETTNRGRMQIGGVVLDKNGYTVTVDGAAVSLTPTEFTLLATLMSAPGRAFTREMLLNDLVDIGYTGLERTINVHIRNLRTKIEPDPAKPRYIETVFGIGYRFCQDE